MKTLIVDDDPVNLKLFIKYLNVYGQCVPAMNGSDAIQKFKHSLNVNIPFNLIVCGLCVVYLKCIESLLNKILAITDCLCIIYFMSENRKSCFIPKAVLGLSTLLLRLAAQK